MEKKEKIWIASVLIAIFALLAGLASITIYIDPFFHYHFNDNYQYYMGVERERYRSDGIVRHFKYDAIITGTSMSENFKVSDFEEYFGLKAVKVPYSGGYFNELDALIRRAYTSDNDIKMVVRSLDPYGIILDKDIDRKDVDPNNIPFTFPTYLVNDNPVDDINYVLNKTILLDYSVNAIDYTKKGKETTNFDEYTNWNGLYEFGKEYVLMSYDTNASPRDSAKVLDEQTKQIIKGNIEQNIVETAVAHPDTEFYYFFPPYSICWWDAQRTEYGADYWADVEEYALEQLLDIENIKVFSFSLNEGIVCDLSRYKDVEHYDEDVNTSILEWMSRDEGLITKDNYKYYINGLKEFYNGYDYSSLRNEKEKE